MGLNSRTELLRCWDVGTTTPQGYPFFGCTENTRTRQYQSQVVRVGTTYGRSTCTLEARTTQLSAVNIEIEIFWEDCLVAAPFVVLAWVAAREQRRRGVVAVYFGSCALRAVLGIWEEDVSTWKREPTCLFSWTRHPEKSGFDFPNRIQEVHPLATRPQRTLRALCNVFSRISLLFTGEFPSNHGKILSRRLQG